MSPEQEFATPEELLGAHVRRILSRSAVPSNEQDDVAEELYGHLWQRWQKERKHAANEWDAAYAAVAAFGGPDDLAPGLTRAYHGWLYASTIGVLLPAVTPPADRPVGMTRARALLGITIAIWTVLLPLSVWNPTLSPLSEVVTVPLMCFAYVLMVLAFRALPRQQKWALRYVQAFSVALVIGGVVALVSTPVTINFLAILALFTVPAVFGEGFARWVADSRRVGPGLAALILVGALGPWLAPLALASVPDPTMATPGDLDFSAEVSCVRDADQSVVSGTVTVEVTWAKTDLFPVGLFGGLSNTDDLAVGEHVPSMFAPGSVVGDLVFSEPRFVDSVTGSNAASDTLVSRGTPLFETGGGMGDIPIDPRTIQAGHKYVATVQFTRIGSNPATDVMAQVTYDHQHRWGWMATVDCGGFDHGTPVTSPQTPGPSWIHP